VLNLCTDLIKIYLNFEYKMFKFYLNKVNVQKISKFYLNEAMIS
jgi:hypothetical protein